MADNLLSSITLGPISQRVKAKATQNQWKKIVKTAHARGYQVESFLDQSIPEALKSRTKSSLRAEADTTISAAYAPAEKELSQQEERTKALDSKRARDNQYYLEWLRGRSAQLRENQIAADNKVRDAVKGAHDTTVQAAEGLRNQIVTAVTSIPGVVSDPNQSNTLNQDVPAAANQNISLIENARDATERQLSSQETEQAGYDASNFAFMAGIEAKRQGDTWQRLADLGDEKQKLQLTKAADSAHEVARLLDTERDKANQNTQNTIIADRLNVDLAGVQQRADAAAGQLALGTSKLAETIRNNKETLRATKDQQTVQNSMSQARINIQNGKLTLDWYKARHPNNSKSSKGGAGAKSKDPQTRFDYGYALISTSSTPGKPGSGNKPGQPGKAYTPEFVSKNLKLVENQLVSNGMSRKMAQAVVTAFITNGRDRNKDPGNYKNWLPTSDKGGGT